MLIEDKLKNVDKQEQSPVHKILHLKATTAIWSAMIAFLFFFPPPNRFSHIHVQNL